MDLPQIRQREICTGIRRRLHSVVRHLSCYKQAYHILLPVDVLINGLSRSFDRRLKCPFNFGTRGLEVNNHLFPIRCDASYR